ncbi:MAG TPA: LysM peptidoglycan-binding domain-containing protein, partial [Anaerolineae bacterium]
MKSIPIISLLAALVLLGCQQQTVSYPTLRPETPLASLPFFPADAVIVSATPSPEAPITPGKVLERYTVQAGDTLSDIADRYNLSQDELMQMNGLTNANFLRIGQVLQLRVQVSRVAPSTRLIPDSEMVYSPSYAGFDTGAFVARYPGLLRTYSERVDGVVLGGADIVQLVAERYSVGPRVLLALLEFQSGWVTGQPVSAFDRNFPFGLQDGNKTNLYRQAAWAANTLNEGYYGGMAGRTTTLKFKDRSRAQIHPSANFGSVGLELALARTMNWNDFQAAIGTGNKSFVQTYRTLLGDPFANALEPLVPPNLKQPVMRLPWTDGFTWYFTGGPHGGWDSGSAWAAVDFAPRDQAGTCWTSSDWAIASIPGTIVRAEHGRVIEQLDGTDFTSAGWSILYMHMAAQGRVAVGTRVNTGDR